MASRTLATKNLVYGLQQGLEASVMGQNAATVYKLGARMDNACRQAEDSAVQRVHESLVPQLTELGEGFEARIQVCLAAQRTDMLEKFEARLDETCRQAEESAVQRAHGPLVPQVAELGEQLNGHMQTFQRHEEKMSERIIELSVAQTQTEKSIAALRADVAGINSQLEELHKNLAVDLRGRMMAQRSDLSAQILELKAAVDKEVKKRIASDNVSAQRLEDASRAAAAATREASEEAEHQFKRVSREAAALEERLLQVVEAKTAQGLKSSIEHASVVASHFDTKINERVSQVEKDLAAGQAEARAVVEQLAEALRAEQARASKDAESAARRFAEEKVDALSRDCQYGLQRAGQQIDRLKHEHGVHQEELAFVRQRHLDSHFEHSGRIRALQATMPTGDTLWTNLSRAVAAEMKQAVAAEVSQGAAAKTSPAAAPEGSKAGPRAPALGARGAPGPELPDLPGTARAALRAGGGAARGGGLPIFLG